MAFSGDVVEKICAGALVAAFGGVLLVFVALVVALPTMWLMNALFTPDFIEALFDTTEVGFWQALGINILSGILFRSSGSSPKRLV